MSLSPGARLGPYEILSQLGAGGMGEVYRARDTRLGREVAIKVLPERLGHDAEALARFEREARAVAALSHPNILALHDFANESGTVYAVAELLEGETLREKLSGGPLPVRKAIEYATQIAHGLSAAHEKGIVHRDLKPENLFVTKDGRVKILDFGLARSELRGDAKDTQGPTASALTDPGTVMGTVAYMSPEQVRGKPVDARSDIFSFGAVLYEILTGRRAFAGETASDTMSAILRDDPPEIAASGRPVPPAAERILRHCLEKNPEERFQSARDLAFGLTALSDSSATALSGGETALAAARGHFPAFARPLLAAGAALLLIAAGVFLGRRSAPASAVSMHRLTFQRGTIRGAGFLPDGHIVYAAAWNGGKTRLYNLSPDSGLAAPIGVEAGTLEAVSSKGDLAILLPDVDRTGVGTLATVPASGGTPRPLVSSAYTAAFSPDGSTLAVLRRSGSDRYALECPPGKVLAEGEFQNLKFSPDGKRFALEVIYPSGSDRLAIAVAGLDGKTRNLTTDWRLISGLLWRPDGREILFSGNRGDISETGVYAVNLSGKVRKIVSLPGRFGLRAMDSGGRILVARGDSEANVIWSGPPTEKLLPAPPDSDLRSISRDGTELTLSSAFGGNFAYLLKTDGSDPLRLGAGYAGAISPDGKWVATAAPFRASPHADEITLYPTGAGTEKRLEIDQYGSAEIDVFPDSRRIVWVAASRASGDRRYFVVDVSNGKNFPVSPAGAKARPFISPDGAMVAGSLSRSGGPDEIWIFPVAGGSPWKVASAGENESIAGWGKDSKSLFLYRPDRLPTVVDRVDIHGGRREHWKEIAIADTAGVDGIDSLRVALDGRSDAYEIVRNLSELDLIEPGK